MPCGGLQGRECTLTEDLRPRGRERQQGHRVRQAEDRSPQQLRQLLTEPLEVADLQQWQTS
jgi:hypothetical protein